MNIYGSLIVLHLLGACIWVGGHFLLAVLVLPQARKRGDAALSHRMEAAYASVGIPALLLEVSTGLLLAYLHLPDLAAWLDFSNPMGRLVGIKVILLLLTLVLGLDVRFRLFSKIESEGIEALKAHVILITFLSVLMVFVGASFRIGWLY